MTRNRLEKSSYLERPIRLDSSRVIFQVESFFFPSLAGVGGRPGTSQSQNISFTIDARITLPPYTTKFNPSGTLSNSG